MSAGASMPKADLISAHSHDRDDDRVSEFYAFIFAARQDEHGDNLRVGDDGVRMYNNWPWHVNAGAIVNSHPRIFEDSRTTRMSNTARGPAWPAGLVAKPTHATA